MPGHPYDDDVTNTRTLNDRLFTAYAELWNKVQEAKKAPKEYSWDDRPLAPVEWS
jgi:hypothetical protein